MPVIRETILTTVGENGRVHITPIGMIADGDGWIIAPFRPSTTLDNLRAVPFAVANHTDDVRIFAGCLTGRHDWPTRASDNVPVPRLTGTLAHAELAVVGITEDEQRPRFQCAVVNRGLHAPFEGFNRAQAAVIEAAILVSRLHILSRAKIETEIGYLETAIEKTAGAREVEAWTWLMEAVREHYGKATSSPSNRGPI
jgi:uncharacterized protein